MNTESAILPEDELVLPNHRRTVVQELRSEEGLAELHLFYGDKVIVFDEPELFAFGATLAKQSRFPAHAATTWAEGCGWSKAQELLTELLDRGVLMRADDWHAAPAPVETTRPSPLPPSTCPAARSWNECETITRALAGVPVELGHLEVIVPIFRIAHIALDADQRQVGEANVFPPALRLDVPTQWRTCNLPGTRYQSERPMNVTAMRTMRTHWAEMMACVLRAREAFLRRFPDAGGPWSVGRVERLATAVLALPTFQLVRRDSRVENGALHPALSSLFRVTDGVRMTMHQMLFVPIGEPAWSPDQPVGVDDILNYAERNYSFFSEHGVCAGPSAMIRELLCVLLEGRGTQDYASVALTPQVQRACDSMEPALDYGLLGLQAHAAAFSLWPAMSRTYEEIADLLDPAPGAHDRERMLAHRASLRSGTYLGHERWRASREDVYADMYDQCGRGLGDTEANLDASLSPVWSDHARDLCTKLENIIRSRMRLPPPQGDALARGLANCMLRFFLRTQSVLRTAAATQRRINLLLGRDQPVRVLSATTIDVHNRLRGREAEHLPFLIDELERWLDIRIVIDTDRLAIEAGSAA